MAGLNDQATWEPEIYQLERTDAVVGGVPNVVTKAGTSNVPHLLLANRTLWLRAQLEAQQNGAGYRAVITVTASQTLTAADMGECIVFTGTSAATLTLPALSAVPNGSAIEFVNTGTANLTVARAGSDQIDIGPSTVATVIVPPNQSLKLLRAAGASLWHMVSAPAVGTNDVGRVGIFAMSTAPVGWLKANGALVSRTAYAALFAAIGTQYGAGDGSTTFGLPDLRGEFLRGWDDGRGVDVGRVFGSAQAAAIADHDHMWPGRMDGVVLGAGNPSSYPVPTSTTHGSPVPWDGTNPLAGSETRPRNVALLFCIKF